MKYMLLIYGNEAAMLSANKQQVEQMMGAYGVYSEAMKKAGVLVGGERMRPTGDATTVRGSNGKTQVLNGPYAETKEQLGGYYMIEAPDLDDGDHLGRALPGRRVWVDRGAADLAHVTRPRYVARRRRGSR